MSRHEGVSCDSCLKGNFRGKRYKCLICYDYDLCATCYEAGATTTRHTTQHPMQCILTRADFDLYYGGETISVEQPQSFTCPYCGKMGFIEQTLQEHVASDHNDSSYEVVCPVCAALPGGDPNQVTDDFAAHLSLEHRAPRDLDEPSGSRHVRRIPHPGRGVGGTRARRANMHFSTSGGLASLSPSNRDSMDPIAELLSQLSGVRRSTATSQSNASSQLQQLQMQLQLERQQAQAARQQLERLPRRQPQPGVPSSAVSSQPGVGGLSDVPVAAPSASSGSSCNSQFLLSRCAETRLSEKALQELEVERADRSLFIQEFLVHTLADNLNVADEDPPGNNSSVAPAVRRSEEASLTTSASSASPSSCSTSVPSTTQPRTASSTTATNRKASGAGSGAAKSSSSSTRSTPNRDVAPSTNMSVNIPVGRSSSLSSSIQLSSGTGTVREVVYNPSSTAANATRAPLRSSSPSSSRRKIQRHVDSRNQPNEPPPPH